MIALSVTNLTEVTLVGEPVSAGDVVPSPLSVVRCYLQKKWVILDTDYLNLVENLCGIDCMRSKGGLIDLDEGSRIEGIFEVDFKLFGYILV